MKYILPLIIVLLISSTSFAQIKIDQDFLVNLGLMTVKVDNVVLPIGMKLRVFAVDTITNKTDIPKWSTSSSVMAIVIPDDPSGVTAIVIPKIIKGLFRVYVKVGNLPRREIRIQIVDSIRTGYIAVGEAIKK